MSGMTNASTLFQQTYTRGTTLFFYGLVLITASFAGFVALDNLVISTQTLANQGLGTLFLVAALTTAVAGLLGGSVSMLKRLYVHTAIKQDFYSHGLLSYWLQPLIGLVVGVVAFFIVTLPIALIFDYAASMAVPSKVFDLEKLLTGSTFVTIQILFSWIGGYYQHQGIKNIQTGQEITILQSPDNIDLDDALAYKTWTNYQRYMIRWSYTWGLFIFFYGLLWAIGLIVTYLRTVDVLTSLEQTTQIATTTLVLAGWPAAAAGGMGGVCLLLKNLYEHVSIEQDFHRQHLMAYLVYPVIGFVLGFVMYLLLASGYLAYYNEPGAASAVDAGAVIMLQFTLGWLAGFKQNAVTDLSQKLVEETVALVKHLLKLLLNPKVWFDKKKQKEVAEDILSDEERNTLISILSNKSSSQK